MSSSNGPPRIGCIVAPEDEALCSELCNHLSLIEQRYGLSIWHPQRVLPGSNWQAEFDANLADSSIFLLLLSVHFLASEWCYKIALPAALQRQSTDGARVLPILLRPVAWQQTSVAHLAVLPDTGRPLTEWRPRDTAYLNIVEGIQRVIEDLLLTSTSLSSATYVEEATVTSQPLRKRQDRVHMRDAPHVENFCGRDEERVLLQRWIVDERCRVISIVGMGGMGKTHLAAKVIDLVQASFETVFWFSLLNAPPFEQFLRDYLNFLDQELYATCPPEAEAQASQLIEQLSRRRCLLIWDNAETLLATGSGQTTWREGYEVYGQFARRLGESRHQSCLLLTSREQWKDIAWLEGVDTSVRSLSLTGLPANDVRVIAEHRGLSGTHASWQKLTDYCSGNPLTLTVLAATIREVYAGQIASYLDELGETSLREHPDLRQQIDQQFERGTSLEQQILYWLALKRVALSLQEICEVSSPPVSKRQALTAIENLRRRSWTERSDGDRFTLPPTMMDAIIDRFNEYVVQEILQGKTALLASHALMEAQGKEYVRASQVQLILKVIVQELTRQMKPTELEKRLFQHLAALRRSPESSTTYEAGNILNLLIQAGFNLRDADFSGLTVRQAYLQEADLPGVNFAFANLETSVFTDTFGGIISVVWSPQGNLLVAGTATGEIRIWDALSGLPLRTLRGHTDWVWSLTFSPDGETLASGSGDQTVRLWNTRSGQCLSVLRSHADVIWSVAFSPDGRLLATGCGDQRIRLWDAQSGQCLLTLSGHTQTVRSVTFNQDGSLLASGSSDKTGRVWRVADGQCLTVLIGHTDSLRSVAFHPDGKRLASGSSDRTVRLWDVQNGQCTLTLPGHNDPIRAIAFHPAGRIIASGGFDQTVRLWSVETGQCEAVLRSHTNSIWSLAFSPDGQTLASGGEDQTVHLWDTQNRQCFRVLRSSTHGAWALAFSPDGRILASGMSDRVIRLWAIERDLCLAILRGHTEGIWSVAFSPDGEILASGSADQTVRLWHVRGNRCLHMLSGHDGLVFSIAISPDGKRVASGSVDRTIRLWDISSGECLHILDKHTSAIRSVAFSPDGQTLASGSKDGTIRLWDSNSGACLAILRGHEQLVSSVAFSPDGRILASGSKDGTIRLWDIEHGQEFMKLEGHQQWIFSVAISSDGQILASGSGDQTVRLWEISNGACLAVLRGHANAIRSVAFSPDGNMLGSSSYDGLVKLWSRQVHICLRTLQSHQPYEGMNITHASGLTVQQKTTLKALGATESDEMLEGLAEERNRVRGILL